MDAALKGLLIALRDGDEGVRPMLADRLKELDCPATADLILARHTSFEQIVGLVDFNFLATEHELDDLMPWRSLKAAARAIRKALRERTGERWRVQQERRGQGHHLRLRVPANPANLRSSIECMSAVFGADLPNVYGFILPWRVAPYDSLRWWVERAQGVTTCG